MCLSVGLFGSWFAFKKTAKEPIKVYKVLVAKQYPYAAHNDVRYYSPYQNFQYEIGETYHSQLRLESYGVDIGIHTLTSLREAIHVAQEGWSSYRDEHIVVECEIPAGAKYYKGKWRYDGNRYDSIASNSLKLVKILDDVWS